MVVKATWIKQEDVLWTFGRILLAMELMMSTLAYEKDLTEIFANYDPKDPMFLYLPLHNVHDPLEASEEWLDLYAMNSTCSKRRTYRAMVRYCDWTCCSGSEKQRHVEQHHHCSIG